MLKISRIRYCRFFRLPYGLAELIREETLGTAIIATSNGERESGIIHISQPNTKESG